MNAQVVAAVDLGATSGRVMLGHVGHNELTVRPVARFPNGPVRRADGLHWDIDALYSSVLAGLAAAVREEPQLSSIGVDSWAVDYALMTDGQMVAPPFHYRDDRTAAGVERVHAIADHAELYASNGLQFLPFNTLYQFAAEQNLADADGFLLVPDLINYWLTGRQVAEQTNASTTGLLNIATGQWDDALIEKLGYSRSLFPELVTPGTTLGPVRDELGIRADVVAVGSHDTASAVVAVPATNDDFAYISCGTWGLVGVELNSPVLTEASRAANFTNEGGVDGRVRYLHNVMGLWLLSECVRDWQKDDASVDLLELLAAASALTTTVPIFDANDPRFLAPDGMPERIAAWCTEHDVAAPQSRVEFVRSIIESLSVAFVDAVHTASDLSGKSVSVIHIVGGGSQNELLCQLIADRSGMPVLAGPVEATAIGNVLVQARAQGFVEGSLEALRSLVTTAFSPKRYLPRSR
ncbi:rhamnulokinase [Salinibacterium sp. NSLL150]|uniref:rhamnulokinase n=1 Tax=unclassified Salinibacterium TaxID=2632331 RepID=UPI0018CD5B3E|nr:MULTISPECIES: rhamnulokinase family protein [unclassified Salinibacterium]MBH0097599.1 rhamnulokinase [Salinibacterium sp. NSLL35]MBH0100354.1 rhamnulokinase [Salinibacterium sp. NSLL150]MBH0103113.1 rhamnulokinase [Salinibacterium sp. NSLL16]MBH0105874.1 rhamnulokinase [Salinibacterium sp. NSLL17]